MRVLLVTDWAPVEGGVERYFDWLRGALREAGDEAWLLTSSAGSAAGGSAELVAPATTRRAGQVVLQLANPRALGVAREAVRTLAPDVVHVCAFEMYLSPAVFAAFRDVPTLLMVADYKPICPTAHKLLPDGRLCTAPRGRVCVRSGCIGSLHWLRDVPRYALIDRAVRSADRVVTISDWMVGALGAYGIDADLCRLAVPPVDPEYRRSPADAPSFLYVGRLSEEKGVDVLLRALASSGIPAELRLAGDGPERRALETLASSLGLAGRVRFLGQLGRKGLDEQLARTWALVTPSVWAEPFGLVAPEALVRGVPVIVTATGGLAEMITPGVDGLVVANGSERELAAALAEVAAGRTFSLDADRVAELTRRYELDRHVTEIRRHYAELAAARRAGRRRRRS
jgi:glycosyltransferase involved in cell wall biosynthesis